METDAGFGSVEGSFVRAALPATVLGGSNCNMGTLDRCLDWCRARQTGLMMLSQLLWISSQSEEYCGDNCLSWFEETHQRTLHYTVCMYVCGKDTRRGDCLPIWRTHNKSRGGEKKLEQQTERQRCMCARVCVYVPRVDLWQSVELRVVGLWSGAGGLWSFGYEDPHMNICRSVKVCV